MTKPVIEVRGLGKRYRLGQFNAGSLREEAERLLRGRKGTPSAADFWALRDVSFDVAPGEVLGIIGRNGAGKSTLLKLLSRVTEPTTGEARIRGRVASLLEVGTGFHPELTGRENIYLNGAILGMARSEIRRKFDEIVAFAEVEQFLDTPVKRYSSGMYVRLAFAVAAHLEPEVLIVDEVLAVGDAEFQRKCLGKMRSVSTNEGRTVLFVSHNMYAVQNLCDRGLILSHGGIVAEGAARDMVAKYVEATLGGPKSGELLSLDGESSGPGNREVTLTSLQVRPAKGEAITTSSGVELVIDFLNRSDKNVVLDLVLYTPEGFAVLEDWSADDPAWQGRRFPLGPVRTICTIPGTLLNEGTFRVRVMFLDGDTVRPIYDFDDQVYFEVFDDTPRAISWNGKFLGPLRPKLGWRTKAIVDERVPEMSDPLNP